MSAIVNCSVLIVEDDADVREALTDVLEERGARVASAANGREALAKLRGAAPPPTVIVLDLMMPVMNGAEFRAAQQADPSIAHVPVVVLTATPTDPEVEFGAVAWLRKPVKLDELLHTLHAICASGAGGASEAAS